MEKLVLKEGTIRNTYLKIKGGILKMRGSSMEPLIKEGYNLEIEPPVSGELEIGDVAVFSYNSKGLLACHRIVGKLKRKDKTYYLEKGDNSYYIRIVSEDDIIGKVKRIINKEGAELVDTDFVINTFALDLLCKIVVFHHRFKEAIENCLKIRPRLPVFLSTALWRFYCLLLKLALKIKD